MVHGEPDRVGHGTPENDPHVVGRVRQCGRTGAGQAQDGFEEKLAGHGQERTGRQGKREAVGQNPLCFVMMLLTELDRDRGRRPDPDQEHEAQRNGQRGRQADAGHGVDILWPIQ